MAALEMYFAAELVLVADLIHVSAQNFAGSTCLLRKRLKLESPDLLSVKVHPATKVTVLAG